MATTRRAGEGRIGRWRRLFVQLRDAYERGDLNSLARLWSAARAEPWVGPFLHLAEWFYPTSSLLSVTTELNRRIGAEGLGVASRWLLDTAVPGWKADLPAEARDVLSHGPAVVYGNHPSLLTPFLVAAALDRPDLQIVSASFLERFLPSYAPHSLSVELPTNRWWDQLRRGGLDRVLVLIWVSRLRPAMPRPAARETNRKVIAQAAEHVRGGGCVLIAPGGWARRSVAWHPGIGRLVNALSQDPGAQPPALVAFREEHSSDHRVRRLLRSSQFARRVNALLYRKAVAIRFAQPRSLLNLHAGGSAEEIARLLQQDYNTLFPSFRRSG